MVKFIKKLKSEKIHNVLITFQRKTAYPQKGAYVKAYFKSYLVGSGKTKKKAISSIKKKVIDRLK